MKIAIVGASHAGIACALRAKEEYPNSEITLYEKQRTIGFVAQSIPHYLRGDSNFYKLSSYISISELENLGIEVKTQAAVSFLDIKNKKIIYTNSIDYTEHQNFYDKLVIATGSYPSIPLVQGEFKDKFFILKDFESAKKVKKFMNESQSVIIVGGGAIGTEIAKIMSEEKIKTTLIHSSSYILNKYLDEEVAQSIQEKLDAEIITDTVVTEINEVEDGYGRKNVKVRSQDGREYIADGVIYSTGFRPNSFLVSDKLTLGDKGAILIDKYMQTSYPDVFAVGDCATTEISHTRKPMYIPHASDAIRQGEIAALNLVKRTVQLSHSQGTYKLNFDDDNTLCMSGLSYSRAKKEGYNCDIVSIRNDYLDSDNYYETWLVYEKETKLILGIQTVGTAPGIASQADIISLAIQNELTINDIEYTDTYFRHGFKTPKSFMKIIADEVRKKDKSENSLISE